VFLIGPWLESRRARGVRKKGKKREEREHVSPCFLRGFFLAIPARRLQYPEKKRKGREEEKKKGKEEKKFPRKGVEDKRIRIEWYCPSRAGMQKKRRKKGKKRPGNHLALLDSTPVPIIKPPHPE